MLQYNPTVSGSLTITGSLTVTNGVIGTVSGVDVQIFSSSINQVITGIQGSTGSSDAKFETLSGFTSSALTRLTNIETKSASVDISISNINSVTASNIARLSNLETKSSSVDISISNINTFTSSNDTKFTTLATYTGSLDTKNTTLSSVTSSLISKTGSYATTGSNSFYGTQVFSGSVYIANDLVVQGSSSIQYISASSVSIGTNIVQLNTANPSVRFAGLTMIDSGSIGGSGSFLYDSVHDEFVFVHRGNGTNVTSSHFVLGPETYDNLGNEIYLSCNTLSKGTGKEHLVDSCIFDNGTTVCVNTTLKASGQVCSLMGNFSCIGIGTTSPAKTLHVVNTDYQLRLSYDTSGVYTDFRNDSAGGLLINTSGQYIVNYINGSAKMRIDADAICFSTTICSPTIISSGTICSISNTCFGGNTIINGCVGMGTATPTAKLHVYCNADVWHTKIGSACGELRIGGDTSCGAVIQSYTPAGVVRDLYLQRDGGKIGIGTSVPTALLDVYHPTNGYASVGLQGYSGATKWYLTSGISGDTIQDFSISNNNTGTSPKFRISSTGAATFSTTVSTGDMITIGISDISTGENKGLKLNNTGGGGKTWNITAGAVGSNNADFVVRNSTSHVNNLVLDGSSGAAAFSSTISAYANIGVINSGAQGPVLATTSTYADGYRATVRLTNTHTGGKQWDIYSTNVADGVYGAGKFAIANATDSITAISIQSGGIVTKPNQMFVMGGMSSDQSISNSNPTTLNFVTNGAYSWYNQNVGSCWNNSTYTLTAPATGIYVVNASVYTSAYGINQIALYVNGSRKNSIPTGYGTAIAGGSAMVILQAGDTLNLRVFNDVGTITLYGNAYHSWFNIYFLG